MFISFLESGPFCTPHPGVGPFGSPPGFKWAYPRASKSYTVFQALEALEGLRGIFLKLVYFPADGLNFLLFYPAEIRPWFSLISQPGKYRVARVYAFGKASKGLEGLDQRKSAP